MLQDYFNEVINQVNKTIEKYLSNAPSGTSSLYEASKHLFSAGGKRLRPLILVSSCDFLGGDRSRAILAGSAIETLHTFTLIHDDIMDHDFLRRGLPTVHVKWGESMAILAGDLLHAKAFEMLNDSLEGVNETLHYEVMKTFINSIVVVSEGQAMDMQFEGRNDVTEEDYLEMVKKKTAYLIATSSKIGSLIGGAGPDVADKFFHFGIYLGIAFQIVDDIIGITSDEAELGKPLFSDIREGKRTLLVIRTLKEAESRELEVLKQVLGNKNASTDQLKEASQIVKKHSLEYAYSLAEEYRSRAISSLDGIQPRNQEAYEALKFVSEFTLKRKK
ncbi:geranylgeranyl diphosphate synthase [Sulfuracidifex tepidarius]|uniref:Geranylgeranyl diphosphate synthase n=1 Tax=Sulfuracidifex tepidarius TaxID=1294262 RepID=A0A510DXE2_9CREN|nr:geranylgeranyl diphosphate synthase [Sulfuracidifex tepidarius]BBG24650.1 Geranylgeranyl diphosphate synthase [Sulfuracidifex tepidarius]BBG27438.1 Geranylgeranyl diphosphate synthase [Sulfuracidifex tepidarius]